MTFVPILQAGTRFYDLRADAIPSSEYYYLLGDEKFSWLHFESRTAPINDWTGVGPTTPSVVKHYPTQEDKGSVYFTDVSRLDAAHRALNGNDPKKIAYLYSQTKDKTALFNNKGYPYMENLTMQGNILKPLAISGTFLKFETLKPSSNVSGMTHTTHPHFVHRFDIVCYNKAYTPSTYHKATTPHGIIDYFLVTNQGYAFIPLKYVAKVTI